MRVVAAKTSSKQRETKMQNENNHKARRKHQQSGGDSTPPSIQHHRSGDHRLMKEETNKWPASRARKKLCAWGIYVTVLTEQRSLIVQQGQARRSTDRRKKVTAWRWVCSPVLVYGSPSPPIRLDDISPWRKISSWLPSSRLTTPTQPEDSLSIRPGHHRSEAGAVAVAGTGRRKLGTDCPNLISCQHQLTTLDSAGKERFLPC